MKRPNELLADIRAGRASLVEIEEYFDKTTQRDEETFRILADAHAALALQKATESALHGRSRISYALTQQAKK